MNIKKLFAILAGVSMVANVALPGLAQAATPDNELGKAYEWAYSKGITTMDSFEKANMYGNITRAEMSKMLSVYAKTFLGKTADTSKECKFSDIDSVKGDLHDYIIESCQLGIMGQNITAFRPYDTLSRAEFGTALSRALWGDKNNTGTPYYAAHLNALKEAGIMNQINNADSTKEIRGYVMIMLQRASGEENKDLCEMCLATGIGEEKCEAVCGNNNNKEEDNNDEVVKSGDLEVSSSAADDRKVVVASGSTAVSDLDTLTFKTSEEVEVTKVTLEKYGYSSASDLISNVWLEDENGKEVSNKAKPNTKGLVNLTIKKDYKAVDGTFNATIVVETKANAEVGGTVGFKVTDVASTAKNVDLGNYKAYTYDVVRYDGTKATITAKGGDKDYNYEEGKALEVSKFKIKAPDDSSITVNGFTLTDSGTMDIYDNFDVSSIEVTVDGDKVKANADLTKKEELTISFKSPVEIAAKQKVEVVVTTKLNSDFEDYGKDVKLIVKNESDLSATDKNNARVTVDKNTNFVRYIINGGKVKISSTKLGNIEAAINSTDVKLADGEITVSESIEGTLTITAQGEAVALNAIDTMRLEIAGDEYDGTPSKNNTTWTFDNIEVSKSGKIRLYVDILDHSGAENKSITFSIDGWKDLNYVDGQNTDKIDVSGSLNISKLTLTQARGTLVNNLSSSDDIEFPNKELNTFTIFDGTYTAKKQDINLNSFSISGVNDSNSTIRFYLYVDDMNNSVADVKLGTGATALSGSDSFNDVLVKAGESVKVKVEAEVDAKEEDTTAHPFTKLDIGKFTIRLDGEDENDNPNGGAEKSTSKVVIVKKGSVSVSETSTAAKLVLRKSSDAKVAEVTVKPDGSNTVTLESVDFDITFDKTYGGEVKLYVDGSNEDLSPVKTSYAANSTTSLSADLNKTVESEGVAIRIELEDEYEGTVTISNLKVNDKDVKKEFVKRFEIATIWFSNQSSTKIDTKFTFGVDKKSSDSVENVYIYTGTEDDPKFDADKWISVKNGNEVKDGDTFSILGNASDSYYVTAIAYTINNPTVTDSSKPATCTVPATLPEGATEATVVSKPETGWTADNCKYTYKTTTTDTAVFDGTAKTCTLPTTLPDGASDAALVSEPETGWTADSCKYTYKTTTTDTAVFGAAGTTADTSKLIIISKKQFDDYFKVNLKENGDYISIAKAD